MNPQHIEFELMTLKTLEKPVKDLSYAIQEKLLISVIERLIKDREQGGDTVKEGISIAINTVLTYLETLRDTRI